MRLRWKLHYTACKNLITQVHWLTCNHQQKIDAAACQVCVPNVNSSCTAIIDNSDETLCSPLPIKIQTALTSFKNSKKHFIFHFAQDRNSNEREALMQPQFKFGSILISENVLNIFKILQSLQFQYFKRQIRSVLHISPWAKQCIELLIMSIVKFM